MAADANDQARVAQLEKALAEMHHRYELLAQACGNVVYDYDIDAGTITWNAGVNKVLGFALTEMQGGVDQWIDLIHPDDRDETFRLLQIAQDQGLPYEVEYRFRTRHGSYLWMRDHGLFITNAEGRSYRMIGIMEDISSRKQAEQDRIKLQEEIIRAQELALRELSTPLIHITRDVVVMPLVGTIDTRRAQLVIETLLHGIEVQRAKVAVLDITGVMVVDTQVANALIQAAQAARLLGARVLLTGIRPEVAQTLVGLGVGLDTIDTYAGLQEGLSSVLHSVARYAF